MGGETETAEAAGFPQEEGGGEGEEGEEGEARREGDGVGGRGHWSRARRHFVFAGGGAPGSGVGQRAPESSVSPLRRRPEDRTARRVFRFGGKA